MWHHKPGQGVPVNLAHELRPEGGCWLFNEGGGDKAYDLSGQSTPGIISGAAWQGGDLVFDGSDDVLTVSSYPAIENLSEFTIVILVDKTETSVVDRLLRKRTGDNFIDIAGSGTNKLNFGVRTSTGVGLDLTLSDHLSGMTHLTWVINKSSPTASKIYVNGVEDVNGDATGLGNLTNTADMTLGGSGIASFNLGCKVRQQLIYDRPLSAREVRELAADPYCFMQPPFSPEMWYVAAVGVGVVPQIQYLRMHTL